MKHFRRGTDTRDRLCVVANTQVWLVFLESTAFRLSGKGPWTGNVLPFIYCLAPESCGVPCVLVFGPCEVILLSMCFICLCVPY